MKINNSAGSKRSGQGIVRYLFTFYMFRIFRIFLGFLKVSVDARHINLYLYDFQKTNVFL